MTGKNRRKRAGATHFFGFQPPKKFVGSLQPTLAVEREA
jgi:hypothetical protein